MDTSVWVEYLRDTGSAACVELGALLADDLDSIVITEPVAMELLAGASGAALAKVELLVAGLPVVGVEPMLDFPAAAAVFRAARSGGRTVRSLVDCLIAVVAVRSHVELLHRDADYDVLAEVLSGLQVRSYLLR